MSNDWVSDLSGHITPEEYIERFWSRVDKNGPVHKELGQCWQWTGNVTGSGYGLLPPRMKNGKRLKRYDSHRLSWMLHHGFFENRHIHVLHKCDNKRCVNPEHLELGDASKNLLDAQARGLKRIGSQLPFAKLTRDQVLVIRELHESGLTEEKIAPQFGVSRSTIHRAVSNTAYKDVEENTTYVKGAKNGWKEK